MARPTRNLADLADAGLSPGCPRSGFFLGILFPLTPRGVCQAGRSIWLNLTVGRQRIWVLTAMTAVAVSAYLLGGWLGLVFGFLVPRVLIYPVLSWISLLVEHRWFDPSPAHGDPR